MIAMLRLLPLLFAGCGFQLTPGSAVTDAVPGDGARDAVGDAMIDGAIDARMIDAPMTPPTVCDATDANLRACYLFEGNLQDGSMYANAAAGSTSFQNGHSGLGLNAQASDIDVSNHPSLSLQLMTLRMWIRPAAHPTGTTRMGLIENDTFRMFTLEAGRIRCAINDGTIEITTVMGVPLDVWSRVACTYDLSRLKIYIDGTERATVLGVGTLNPATTEMTIGHQQPAGDVFNGMIDDVMVYNAIVAP